ncbi:MAG: hypothetical protein U9Q96_01580 [Patescibacteria group bacterium]|nr:hypothetical protein [Patescibacteria group bacterium]
MLKPRWHVREAMEILTPSIERLLRHTGRPGFHFIVLNPRVFPWMVNGDVRKAILHEGFIGGNDGRHEYREIALSKAKQAWISGMPNIFVQTSAPVLLQTGDTPYFGSFVYNGAVAAVSGLDPWFDQLVSMWIAGTFQEATQSYRQKWMKEHPDEDFFP